VAYLNIRLRYSPEGAEVKHEISSQNSRFSVFVLISSRQIPRQFRDWAHVPHFIYFQTHGSSVSGVK
jgi:hypothetical protein